MKMRSSEGRSGGFVSGKTSATSGGVGGWIDQISSIGDLGDAWGSRLTRMEVSGAKAGCDRDMSDRQSFGRQYGLSWNRSAFHRSKFRPTEAADEAGTPVNISPLAVWFCDMAEGELTCHRGMDGFCREGYGRSVTCGLGRRQWEAALLIFISQVRVMEFVVAGELGRSRIGLRLVDLM